MLYDTISRYTILHHTTQLYIACQLVVVVEIMLVAVVVQALVGTIDPPSLLVDRGINSKFLFLLLVVLIYHTLMSTK
jgi:hypothetical protein